MHRSVGLALVTMLTLTACATRQERVEKREDLLSAAGFRIQPADTPERRASLGQLPPDRLVRQTRGGQVTYLYADPLVCGCLYAGDQGAYDRFRRETFQRQLADERLTAATEISDWGWGPWGGPW